MEFDRANALFCGKRALPTARALLLERGNRVTLILSILICAVASFSAVPVVSWPLTYLLDWESLYYNSYSLYAFLYYVEMAACFLCFFFTAFPLYLGLYRMAVRMSREESVHLLDTFYYFSSASLYRRALMILLRMVGFAAPVYGAGLLLSSALMVEDSAGLVLFSACLLLVVFLLCILLFSLWGGYTTLAILKENAPLAECRAMARELSRGRMWGSAAFLLSLSWRLLLSLLPAGVLFLVHTMPMSLLASANYVGRLSEGVIDLNS